MNNPIQLGTIAARFENEPDNMISIFGLPESRQDPDLAEFWRLANQRINDAPELTLMLAAGYEPEMTGGGGLAWRKSFHDGSYLFITYFEHDVGGNPADPVWIAGRYTDFQEQTLTEPDENIENVTLEVAMKFTDALELKYGPAHRHRRQTTSPADKATEGGDLTPKRQNPESFL